MNNLIEETRKALNMTQEELSEKAGVSRTIISGLESGRVKNTTAETLIKIAGALNSKVSDIFFAQ